MLYSIPHFSKKIKKYDFEDELRQSYAILRVTYRTLLLSKAGPGSSPRRCRRGVKTFRSALDYNPFQPLLNGSSSGYCYWYTPAAILSAGHGWHSEAIVSNKQQRFSPLHSKSPSRSLLQS